MEIPPMSGQLLLGIAALWVTLLGIYANTLVSLYVANKVRQLRIIGTMGGIFLAAFLALLAFLLGGVNVVLVLIVGLLIAILVVEFRRSRWRLPASTSGHFHPIRLDQEDRANWRAPTVDSGLQTYRQIHFPRGKIWLGDVLFEIASHEYTGELNGISVSPDRANNAVVRTIAEQVDDVMEVDIIVTAGSAYKFEPTERVRFEGKRIGRIELHFEGEAPQIVDLILGDNIREWARKSADVVDTFSDTKAMQNVWQSLNGRFVQDMLKIPVEDGPKRLVRIKIVGEFGEDVSLREGNFPTIQVAAISCRVAIKPAD